MDTQKDLYIRLFSTNLWFTDYINKKLKKKKDGRVWVDVRLRRLGGVVWNGWRDG